MSKSDVDFVDETISRMIFDYETLSDLFISFELGWEEQEDRESDLMQDLIPMLNKLAGGREISGLSAYNI